MVQENFLQKITKLYFKLNDDFIAVRQILATMSFKNP